jgi:8-oxo-dGTP diphosphatase
LNATHSVSGRSQSTPSATVCFIRRNGKVLLQQRAPGRIWAGRLNGPGGKIDAGETPEAAVVREVKEETGLRLLRVEHHGILDLYFGDPDRSQLRVFAFSCKEFTGRARGGREGTLRWYAEQHLPYEHLWPDMRYWLPMVLDGGAMEGRCIYDRDGNRLLSCSINLQLSPTRVLNGDTLVTYPCSGTSTTFSGLRGSGAKHTAPPVVREVQHHQHLS